MIYKIGFVGLLLAGMLTGCMKDDTTVAVGEGDATIQIQLQTYAVNSDSNAAGDAELIVKSAYVFIFNEYGVLENAGNTAVGTPTATGEVIDASGTLNASWKVYAGTKDLYVVANPGQELSGRLATMSATNGLDKATLEAVMTAEDKFLEDVAAFATKGMIMSGKTEAAPVSGSGTKITVPLRRRHARIDLHMRRAKDLEGAEVKVKGVKLKDQIRKTYAFDISSAAASTAYAEEKTLATNIATQQNTEGEWSATLTDYTSVTSFYSFERAVGGSVKAVCLEVTLTINGVDKVVPVYICSTAIGTDCTGNDENRPVKIEGNYVYRVLATLGRQSTDVALNIVDWADAPVAGDISGSEFDLPGRVELNNLPDKGTVSVKFSALEEVNLVEYEYMGEIFTDPTKLPSFLKAENIDIVYDDASRTSGTVSLTYTPDSRGLYSDVKLWFTSDNIRKSLSVGYRYYHFEVATISTIDYPYGTTRLIGFSYSEYDNKNTPLPCQVVEWSVGDEATWTKEAPDNIQNYPTSVVPTSAQFGATYFVAPLPDTSVSSTALRSAYAVSDYNLSNSTGAAAVENTANCYMVNAPGTYRLPLVYGNAIKAGADNTSAYYNPSASGTNMFKRFRDYKDADITSPYIYTNNTPADGCLVWSDAFRLVENVALSADGQWLTFEVPQEKIQQGNAIVAVRDASGQIIWSWHIWVTNYRLGNNLVTLTDFSKSNQYTSMPWPLGYCTVANYPTHKIRVRWVQSETGLTYVHNLTINSGAAPSNHTLYQFGRKDPMLPITRKLRTNQTNSYDYIDKPAYTESSDPFAFTTDTGFATVGAAMQRPGVFFKQPATNTGWLQGYYYNIWDATRTSAGRATADVVKTVYDPSPAGYCLPPSDAYTNFVSDGYFYNPSTTPGVTVNGRYTSIPEGGGVWAFNTGVIGQILHVYCFGMRETSGAAMWTDRGFVQTAHSVNNYSRYALESAPTFVNTRSGHNNVQALAVYPVREK